MICTRLSAPGWYASKTELKICSYDTLFVQVLLKLRVLFFLRLKKLTNILKLQKINLTLVAIIIKKCITFY